MSSAPTPQAAPAQRVGVLGTVAQVNAVFLRPFTQQVDIVNLLLLFVLLLVASGLWHITLTDMRREITG